MEYLKNSTEEDYLFSAEDKLKRYINNDEELIKRGKIKQAIYNRGYGWLQVQLSSGEWCTIYNGSTYDSIMSWYTKFYQPRYPNHNVRII